ncbi:MAG: glucokinase [Gemmatimonadetes bacterium]|nr:glucokinase [Gemmatimonadota bacterium]
MSGRPELVARVASAGFDLPASTDARAVLAGDVGGTKTVLALICPQGSVLAEAVYASREFPGLEPVVARFRAAHPAPVRCVAMSVAGPVIRGQARITNLPWRLDAARLRDALGVDDVRLVNDLQATAHALPHLHPEQIRTLQRGVPEPAGPRAVIAVGTGLGEAMLLPRDGGFVAVPSEGGHADFAPRGRLQRALLAHLHREHDHVSYERVCSGLGIPNLYGFLRARSGLPEPAWLAAAFAAADDTTPVIVAAGMRREGRCEVCRRTLRVFAAILGAEAGNLALRTLATGGVYVGGGIPPRLLPVLRGRAFAEGFLRKGPMSAVVARIPVHAVMEPRTALLGAARYGMTAA